MGSCIPWDRSLMSVISSSSRGDVSIVTTFVFTGLLALIAVFAHRLNWVFIVAAVVFGARAAYLTYRWYRGRKEERASS